MPEATINGPIIKERQIKRTLVKEITDALEKAYGIPRSSYVVTIVENHPENTSIGGILVADKKTART